VLWHESSGNPHGSSVEPGLLQISVADALEALHTLRERLNVAV